MTQFASIPPKIPPLVDELDDDGLDTPTRIDREVKKLRSVRPAEVTELRERPRLSISELNDLDWNQVRERMAKTSFDNRGPVTRFLDLIDLPRNTIANVIASGIAPKLRQRQTDEGETAALGQPRVYTSDILKELGVRPGIVAGTLGFIGDVALDPLTYAGPPGWGAKVATKGGQIVRIGAQGRRAAQAAIKATAKGQEIADPALRSLYHENVIPRLVGEHTAAQRAEALSKSVFGDARTDLVGRLKRGDIFELSGSGGDIAESTLRPRAASDPAKDFLARYGEGAPSTTEELAGKAGWAPRMTPKGLAFGNGQTAIAHIPFTEYGIYVPGTTRAGRSRAAQRLGALAVSGSTAEARTLFDFDALTKEMQSVADTGMRAADMHANAWTPEEARQSLADVDYARQTMAALEAKSSEVARNFAHSDKFNADDLLNAYQKLASVRESRKALEASLDAIPGTIKSNDVTGAAYRSFRDEELAKVRGVAEAELNLPALRSELRAKADGSRLYHGTRTADLSTFIDADGNLVLRAGENFGGKQVGVSFAPSEATAWDYATRRPGEGPVRSRANASVFEIDRDSLPTNRLKQQADDEISAVGSDDVVIPKGKYRILQDSTARTELDAWAAKERTSIASKSDDDIVKTAAESDDFDALEEGMTEGMAPPTPGLSEEIVAAFGRNFGGHFAWEEMRRRVAASPNPRETAERYFALYDGIAKIGQTKQKMMEVLLTPPPDLVTAQAKVPASEARTAKIAEAEAKLPAKIEELRKRNAATVANGVLDMSDGELEKRAFEVEALHRQFEAMTNLEAVTKGAIVSNLTNDQRALRDLSKYLLGIDDDMLKTGPMLGMATAAKEAMGKDRDAGLGMVQSMAGIDGSLRQLFGDRRSMYDKLRNSVARTVETGSPFETMAVARSVAADRAKPVIRALGLKTDDQLDKFWTLVHTRVFNLLNQANPEQVLSKVVEKGKLVDSPWAKALKSAQSDGWFGSPVDPERFKNLMPEVDGIAADIVKHYRDLGADLGEAATGVYAPNRLTPMAAREAARKSKGGYNVGKSGGSSEFTAGAQAFEQPRSMMVYQWEDTGGKWHELTEADFGYVSHFRDEKGWKPSFAEQSDQTKKNIEAIAAEVDSFAQTHPGVDAATRRQYLGKIADPWYLNQNDRMKAITGGSELAEDIFSTNALHLLAQRQSEQFAAKARQSFSPILDRLALEAVKERVRVGDRSAVGTKVHFRGGGEGVILNGAGDHAAVLVGDTIYRPLKIDPRDLGKGMMQGVLDSRDLLRYYPEQFAEMVERAHKIAGSENDLSSIAKTADKLTSIWKSTTLAHPSWPIFNMVGLLWNSLMGGIPLDIIARHAKDAKRMTISRGDLSTLAGRTVTLNGQQHNLAELAVAAHKGWGGSGFAGEAMSQAQGTYRNIYGPGIRPGPQNAQEWASGAVDAVRGYPAAVRSDFNRRLEAYARSYAVKNAPNAAEKIKIASELLYDEAFVRKFFGPFFRANAMMEEWYKTAAYMAMLDQGQSPLAAANHIAETFYDFTNMTNAERNVRRYVIPFYSWMRNNGAYQLRKFLEDPKWAALAPKVKEAIEEAIAGENQVPEHARPSWMREQLAIQIGEEPSSRSALNIGTVIPTEPVYQAGGALTGNEGVMNLIKWFTSGLNPVLNVPLQLGAGRESFTGREIGPSRGEGDLSMSEFLANQIRPVREWGAVGGPRTAPGVKAFERGIGQGIGRATLGGRFQPFDDDRIRQASEREYRDRVENLRRYIKVAESNGDQEESLKARAKLMVVFQAMERAGLEPPKWAKKQLEIESK